MSARSLSNLKMWLEMVFAAGLGLGVSSLSSKTLRLIARFLSKWLLPGLGDKHSSYLLVLYTASVFRVQPDRGNRKTLTLIVSGLSVPSCPSRDEPRTFSEKTSVLGQKLIEAIVSEIDVESDTYTDSLMTTNDNVWE